MLRRSEIDSSGYYGSCRLMLPEDEHFLQCVIASRNALHSLCHAAGNSRLGPIHIVRALEVADLLVEQVRKRELFKEMAEAINVINASYAGAIHTISKSKKLGEVDSLRPPERLSDLPLSEDVIRFVRRLVAKENGRLGGSRRTKSQEVASKINIKKVNRKHAGARRGHRVTPRLKLEDGKRTLTRYHVARLMGVTVTQLTRILRRKQLTLSPAYGAGLYDQIEVESALRAWRMDGSPGIPRAPME